MTLLKSSDGKKKKKKTSTKNIMREFQISEISAVDIPAQAGATVAIMKRNGLNKKLRLTNSVDGHAHLLDDGEEGGETSWQDGHTHPWVRKADGSITIGEEENHTHELLEDVFEMRYPSVDDGEVFKAVSSNGKTHYFFKSDYLYVGDSENSDTWHLRITSLPGSKPDRQSVDAAVTELAKGLRDDQTIDAEVLHSATVRLIELFKTTHDGDNPPDSLTAGISNKESEMTEAELLAKIAKDKADFEKKLAEQAAELEIAKAFATMTDIQKIHCGTLSADDQIAFRKMSDDERTAAVTKATADDPVVYTDSEGNVFRKSDDVRLIAAVKRSDAALKKANTESERADNLAIEKRITDDLSNLPGDQDTKIALIKAIDGIADEGKRTKAYEALKAQNTALAKATEIIGHGAEPSLDESSPAGQLDTLAKAYVKAHDGTDYNAAYAAVLETEEGQRLYDQSAAA